SATGGAGGAGGSADPCADCKTLDHCCALVSLDGCTNAGACVATSGSQQQTMAARCRTDLNSFITNLPAQAMTCGATSGGGGMNTDGGARDTNAGGSGGSSGGGADGGACPAQQPTTTSQGGDLVYQSCSIADQNCQYRAAFCRCQHAPGTDAGSALVWVCQPII
ncbi:MAG TPA: hypothetical protein VNO55_16365, partial [Polyangia bacterium]|nr:hypothetical protein [Polyangia bacterium]